MYVCMYIYIYIYMNTYLYIYICMCARAGGVRTTRRVPLIAGGARSAYNPPPRLLNPLPCDVRSKTYDRAV